MLKWVIQMDKTPVFYFDWLKEQYPDTLKYASYSNDIELYKGYSDNKDLSLSITSPKGNTRTNYFSSGGVIREFDLEIQPGIIDHHKIEFSTYHIPFNKKVYIHAKNVKDVLNPVNAKSILFQNKKISFDEFISLYGRKVMAVDYDGNFYHNMYDSNFTSWTPSLFYNTKQMINSQQPVSVIVKSNNLVFPVLNYNHYNNIIPHGYNRNSNSLQFSYSHVVDRVSESSLWYYGCIIGAINKDDIIDYGNPDIGYLECNHDFLPNELYQGQMYFEINHSLYKDKLPIENQFFYFSNLDDFITVDSEGIVDFTNLNYSMLYTKESIEEYLRAFGIDFEWVYDVVGDDDFVQGRKVRHPSLINQPATLEFSKQRHQSLINQPATQAVKKVRHIL